MTGKIVWQCEVADEAGTAAFGHRLARVLPARCLICLAGTLGAGKTRLVQAVAEALGIDRREVTSPTFVLMQEYHLKQQNGGPRMIYHVDAYRLRDDDEFLQLGVTEHFDEDALVFIEWAERVERCLPRERIEIQIEVLGDAVRRLTVRAVPEMAHVIERLK